MFVSGIGLLLLRLKLISVAAWVDINLTVTPETIALLFSLLSDPSLPIRLATCLSLNKIVTKGLKVASDKVKLIQVLSLGPVLNQLEAQTKTAEQSNESVLSFREALARLGNSLGIELVTLCNDVRSHTKTLRRGLTADLQTSLPPDEIQASGEMLLELMPTILRLLADPDDDTSSSVLPLLTEILLSVCIHGRRSSLRSC
jgi:exportin-T